MAIEVSGKTIETDEEGYLANRTDWSEDVAKEMARVDSCDLKVLVDCTNPVGPGLTHALQNTRSGSEMIQSLLPQTQVVKAFTIYGYENLENPAYPAYNVKPVMLYCGRHAASKRTVAALIEELGWQPMDVGGIEQALHLEHMTLLRVRMVRVNGHSPQFVWALLER